MRKNALPIAIKDMTPEQHREYMRQWRCNNAERVRNYPYHEKRPRISEEKKDFIREHSGTMRQADIAKRIGCSQSFVRSFIVRYNLPVFYKASPISNMTDDERKAYYRDRYHANITKRRELARQWYHKHKVLKCTSIRLDDSDKAYIIENSEKYTQNELAEWIGCAKSTIWRFINTHNLPRCHKKHARHTNNINI